MFQGFLDLFKRKLCFKYLNVFLRSDFLRTSNDIFLTKKFVSRASNEYFLGKIISTTNLKRGFSKNIFFQGSRTICLKHFSRFLTCFWQHFSRILMVDFFKESFVSKISNVDFLRKNVFNDLKRGFFFLKKKCSQGSQTWIFFKKKCFQEPQTWIF